MREARDLALELIGSHQQISDSPYDENGSARLHFGTDDMVPW
jgi:hypothetical protein